MAVPVVPGMSCDGTQCFACQQRLKHTFGDEWELMHRQAITIARISPLSYDEAVERIILRESLPVVPVVTYHSGKKTTLEAFEEFGKALRELVQEMGKVLEPFAKYTLDKLEPPASAMDRALQARKNRNTGPARPTGQAARRPRRHQ